MSYIGTEPKDIRSFGRTKFDYTATQGQTAFTGADDDGKVLAFTVGQIEVYVNGILMDDSDFTTTGTGTVTLATAANLNDVVNVVSFETNIPDSNYVPASGGTFTGAVTHSGNVTNSGNVTVGGTLGVTGAVTVDGNITTGNTSVVTGGRFVSSQTSNDPWLKGVNSSNTETSFIKKDGQIYSAFGISLGGTGASNTLDDYEEGNWTPSVSVGTATAYQNQWYVKIGQLVTCYFYLYSWSNNSDSGQIVIGGLPFAFETAHESYFNVSVLGVSGLPTSSFNVNGRVGQAGSNSIGLELSYHTAQSSVMRHSHIGSNSHISTTFSYITA